jgi:hypothetical protein
MSFWLTETLQFLGKTDGVSRAAGIGKQPVSAVSGDLIPEN